MPAAAASSSTSSTAKHNVYGIAAGNTGVQMGGWFRKEIHSLGDLEGLTMRVAGIAGEVLGRLGVQTRAMAGGEIYPALASGTLDAAEWVGPYDDEKLGFYKVAKFYYYPGWWEAGTSVHLFFNRDKWESLPDTYKGCCRMAAGYSNLLMQAKYDVQNPAALKRLVLEGVELRQFPAEIMQRAYEEASALYASIAETNAEFRKVLDPWMSFRSDGYLWLAGR